MTPRWPNEMVVGIRSCYFLLDHEPPPLNKSLVPAHMSSFENLFYVSSRDSSGMPNSFFRGFTDSGEINNTNLQTALDAHRMATFTINQKRRSIPE